MDKECSQNTDFSGDIEEIELDYKTDFWSWNHFDSLCVEKVTMHLCEYLKNNFENSR